MSAEDVAKDFISFDSSISACEKSGRWNESVDLLGSMRCQTVECIAPLPHPSLCFFFNQRSACLVQNVLHVLRRSIAIATKVISYNSLISSCEKGGQWDLALSVLRNLRSKYLDATDAWLLCFASKRAAVTYEPIDPFSYPLLAHEAARPSASIRASAHAKLVDTGRSPCVSLTTFLKQVWCPPGSAMVQRLGPVRKGNSGYSA